MKSFDNLLERLSKLKITQESYDWVEDLPTDIWEGYFKDEIIVAQCNLDADTPRWHETSVSVTQIFDRFIGVRSVTNIFSEMMGWGDCYHTLRFFEMEEVQITSYKRKV